MTKKVARWESTLPGCTAKRCGEHSGWMFSSHPRSERFSSASQSILWGELSYRVNRQTEWGQTIQGVNIFWYFVAVKLQKKKIVFF